LEIGAPLIDQEEQYSLAINLADSGLSIRIARGLTLAAETLEISVTFLLIS
jgi:hypothetical protein